MSHLANQIYFEVVEAAQNAICKVVSFSLDPKIDDGYVSAGLAKVDDHIQEITTRERERERGIIHKIVEQRRISL